MDKVQFKARVYPPPDVPLVNGEPPVVPEAAPDDAPTDRWPLVVLGVTLACFVAWRLLPDNGLRLWPWRALGGALALLFWWLIARIWAIRR